MIHTVASNVAGIIRSFVPMVQPVRQVDLSPLLGYQWPLLALKVCPRTGNVYVGGHNTPILYVAPDDPKPRWLCGPSWEDNCIKTTSDINSMIVTSIDICDSGLIIFTIGSRGVSDFADDSVWPWGVYTVRPGGKPEKLTLVRHGETKPLRRRKLRACALSADESFLILVSESHIFKVAFDENSDGSAMVLKEAPVEHTFTKCTLLPDSGLFVLFSEHHVCLVNPQLKQVTIPMNLAILGSCVMRHHNTSSVVLHSTHQVRVACEEVFTESFNDAKLKQRLERESSLLWSKNILIDIPLLGFDQTNNQLVTDIDSRILCWLDLY